jgi:hypothetical protein
MIESQFCSMSDEKDFSYEETKSTILDYFMFFKQTKFAVSCIAAGSAIVFFLFFQILVNAGAVFVDLGHFYTIPPSPFAFVHPLDAVFMWTMIGFVITPGVIVPISWLFWKTIVRGRKIEKRLIEIQTSLIRRSYLTNFELVEPEIIIQGGDPKLEKFVNHLSLVFTDINKKNEKRLKKRKTVEQAWNWNRRGPVFYGPWKNSYFATRTSLGVYVVQSYENKVTIENVKTIVKKVHLEKAVARLSFGEGVSYRVIIMGKEFDDSFSDDNILTTMNELKRKCKVDIILETEYGYSTVWID